HMSLTGIRDISTIETPPLKRLPVQVLVAEQSQSLLKDAITRELARGGQVFVLYNRVTSIYSFAKKLQDSIPGAKMIVAHGKLPPQQLESAIEKFVLGEADILVSTTIIENGIDIPRANTMIVIDADRFGLSQLYQLKGRVGRSDKLAYVYYLYQQDKVLSETAHKRLSAIMEFTEFGSGFKIAMRDLEIRGSGNVLGREQHGHMEAVGYDMYCKLLRQSVDELSGKVSVDVNTEMDVDITAYIPEDYITLSSARMEQYRLISGISSQKDIDEIKAGMEDIYGKVPNEVASLCKISLIRHLGEKLFAKKIYIKDERKEIILVVESLKNEKLHDILEINKGEISLDISDEIVLKINQKDKNKALNYIFDLLNAIFIEK
ncbi:MAG: helicase-related protein, partial [Clostridia bacterium]